MRSFIHFILILLSLSIHAQEIISKKWKFAFQFDNRFSSIRGNDITILGAKIGLQYKNLTRLGVGASFITHPVSIDFFNKKLKIHETTNIFFWYISVYNDWIFYHNKNLQCFITDQIGYGKPTFVREINDEIVSNLNIGLIVNEVSGQANYKVAPWIGFGAGIGYRNILNTQASLKNTFNAPVYIVKVIVYPDDFFSKAIQKHNIKKKNKNLYNFKRLNKF